MLLFFPEFSIFIDKCPNEELKQALLKLVIPKEKDSKENWQSFAIKLRKVMQTHYNIGHKWNFTHEQKDKLARYFEANYLLVECLKSAVVSDRERIENSLLTFEKL